MSEIENKEVVETAEQVEQDVMGELSAMFSSEELALLEEDISISEDLTGFAKGFPDWDLHPPKNLRHKK